MFYNDFSKTLKILLTIYKYVESICLLDVAEYVNCSMEIKILNRNCTLKRTKSCLMVYLWYIYGNWYLTIQISTQGRRIAQNVCDICIDI